MDILKTLKISLSTILLSSVLARGRRVSRRKGRKSEVSGLKKKSKENIGKIENGRISKKSFESNLSFLLMSSFTLDFIVNLFICVICNDEDGDFIFPNIISFIIKLVFSIFYIFSITISFSHAFAFYNMIIILHDLFSSLFNLLFLLLFSWLGLEIHKKGGNNKYIVLILPIAETVIASFLNKQLSSSNWIKDKFLI